VAGVTEVLTQLALLLLHSTASVFLEKNQKARSSRGQMGRQAIRFETKACLANRSQRFKTFGFQSHD
jgi:hypothetical protein